MELKKQIIKKVKSKGKEFIQITLDDDYIVKDSKPDVIKIIHSQGSVALEETRINSGAVWINGRMDFMVLYRSDDAYNKTEVLSGTIPFQEKIVMDGISEVDQPQLIMELEDLSVGLINSRKLTIRSVINAGVMVEEVEEDELVSAVEEPGGYQQKQSEKDMLSLISAKKDVFRVKKEIVLSNNKPNMRRILWYSADVRNLDNAVNGNKIQIQGELYPTLLYLSEEDQLEWVDTMLSFSEEIEAIGSDNPDVYWIKPILAQAEVEAKNDSDGECRKIAIDMTFEVYYKLWKEEKISLLEDVYALDREIVPKKERTLLPCFRMKNVAKVRVSDTFTLESNQEKILQICSYKGTVRIDRTTITEQGICFEGILQVHILYLTAEDNFPLAHLEEVLPFEQLVEVDQISENTWYEYMEAIDQLQVNLLDNSEYEIKALLRIAVLAFEEESIEKICEVEEMEENISDLMERPGLIGYVAGEQEDLWDVAKSYHTTVADIMETNELKSRKLKPGTKIIIVKSVSPC